MSSRSKKLSIAVQDLKLRAASAKLNLRNLCKNLINEGRLTELESEEIICRVNQGPAFDTMFEALNYAEARLEELGEHELVGKCAAAILKANGYKI